MIFYPIQDLLEVPTLMRDIEAWVRIIESLNPIVSNHCYISATHNDLSEHFGAVI
jgi:hypothetical protein